MVSHILTHFPKDELIVVDNSADGLGLDLDKKVRKITTKDCTTGRARNLGAKSATGDILYFLDDDITFSNKWSEAVNKIKKRKTIDITGGQVDIASKNSDQIPKKYRYLTGEKKLSNQLEKIENNYVGACNMLIARDVFSSIKGFPMDMGHGRGEIGLNEEVLLQDVARVKGYSVFFDPDILVFHHWEGEKKDLFKRAYLQGKYNQKTDLRLNKKYFNKRYILSIITVMVGKILGNGNYLPKRFVYDYYKGKGYLDEFRGLRQ